jgi:HEAT repeat protein
VGDGAGLPASLPAALALLDDASPAVRRTAVHALQQVGRGGWSTPRVVDALVARLADPDGEVGKAAAWALVNIRAYRRSEPIRGAIPGALHLLRGDAEAQAAGLRVLALLGEEAAGLSDRAAGFLRSADRQVRGAAAFALGEMGPAAAATLPALEAARARAEDDRERGRFESAIRRIEKGRRRRRASGGRRHPRRGGGTGGPRLSGLPGARPAPAAPTAPPPADRAG